VEWAHKACIQSLHLKSKANHLCSIFLYEEFINENIIEQTYIFTKDEVLFI